MIELVAALMLFCLSGPGLIILNKHIYADLGFSFPMSVSNLGNIFLVIVMRGGVRLGLCSLRRSGSALPWGMFLSNVVPLSMCTSLSIVVGNVVYLYLSLPLIQILKTCTLVLVMIFGFMLGVERFRWGLVLAIITMVAGISVAMQSSYDATGEGSPNFFKGVFIMIFGNVMEALRAVMLQVSVEKLEFTDSLYWCSPTMALVGLTLAIPMEMRQAMQVQFQPELVAALIGSAFLGGCVSFSTFWITKLVGGLSVKVLVNARNIGLILYSVIVLGEKCSDMEYMGYSIALVGIAMYDRVRQGPAAPATVAPSEETAATTSEQGLALEVDTEAGKLK